MTALLSLQDVHAAYGRVRVLFGVSLEVNEGEIVALLGPNGAGKTSTLRAISGVVRAEGPISFAGRRIDGRSPDEIARLGIAHVPEGRGLFPSLSVEENLAIGTYVAPPGGESAEIDRAYEIFPALKPRARQLAGTMSGGEQQMLAIARGLVSRPRLLMLDEMSLGLAPAIVESLFALVPRIAASGTAVLLVEQFVGHALRVADRAYVLETGRLAFSGPASDLARKRDFVEASYLGRGRVAERDRRISAALGERVSVSVPAWEMRELEREARAAGRSVEELVAERLTGGAKR